MVDQTPQTNTTPLTGTSPIPGAPVQQPVQQQVTQSNGRPQQSANITKPRSKISMK